MLKPKNQVTLFVNYSYNSFYDFRFSENTYREQKVVPKYGIFDFILDIPLTNALKYTNEFYGGYFHVICKYV